MRHIPRFTFSDRQNELFLWCLTALGVPDVPSDSALKELDEALQAAYGIRTIRYEGSLGHIYYVNDIRSIVAQVLFTFIPFFVSVLIV